MGYSEVVETRGKLRVRLVLDEGPSEPYDDGGSPIIRIDRRSGRYTDRWEAEQVTATTSYVLDERIVSAARKFGPGQTFERYLRIFHGTTCFVVYDSHESSYWYATFDTADWRQKLELTDEWLDLHPDTRGQLANMDEYKAWCEGDVYGWVVERETTWHKDGDPEQTMTTWEDVESCWGYYGREYGEQAAREALGDAASDEPAST